jgi:glucosamine--fructose-6-phosphate aminotransferase (isomerizing)
MCGIVGYVGPRQATPILLDGLARLEYRGYDSAGLAVLSPGGIEVRRAVGRVEAVRADAATVAGTIGIGHTRWATHGAPTRGNAHPHTDCTGRIAVVHNGIITNHAALRAWLEPRGHRFTSQTDSEVIAHALEEFACDDLAASVQKVADVLEGEYAIAVIAESAGACILAARRGHAPLLIGLGAGECIVASDPRALASHASTMVALEDGDIAVVRADGIEVTDHGMPVHRVAWPVAGTSEEPDLGRHPHFMHKEIHEQPSALRRTLQERAPMARDAAARRCLPKARWRRARRIRLVACGTSYHAALVGRWFFEGLARLAVDVEPGSEFLVREPLIAAGDICIFVSQSGETADTLAAAEIARARGAAVVALCNVPGSSLTRLAETVALTATGPEVGVASTKAFTAQVVVLLLLALEAARARDRIASGHERAILMELAALPDAVESVLHAEARVAALADEVRTSRDVFYLGRGLYYPIALEGALKLKEVAYVHAEAVAAGEMKHGPLALVDERVLSVTLAPAGRLLTRMLTTMHEVRARGGRLVALTTPDAVDAVAPLADHVLTVPAASDWLLPALLSVPLQLLAYHTAVLDGHDVDRPRNLAKSVTVA